MPSEINLRVNAPFVKYVLEQEQKNISNPIEPKRSIFERIDEGIGLNWLKRNVKKYTGITYLSNIVTKMVDDGDDNNLSRKERLWEGVKGCGKAIDNFIGSQGLAFMGMLALGSYAAGLAGIGRLFNIATKSYFLFQGTKLAVKGTKEFVKADTKEDAKEGATTAATGGIMLFGTVKGIVKDVKAYNTAKTNFRTSVETSRAKLEIPDGEVLTEASLKKAYRQAAIKNHPDKGGSEAAMAEVTAAFEFLSQNMKSASKIRTSAVPAPTVETPAPTTSAQPVSNPTGEMGLVLASHYNNVKPLIIPLNPVPKTPVQSRTAKTVSIETGVEVPTTVEGMRTAIENATDIDVLRSLRGGLKHMPQDVKALYVQKEQFLRANLLPERKAVLNQTDKSSTENIVSEIPDNIFKQAAAFVGEDLSTGKSTTVKPVLQHRCIRKIDFAKMLGVNMQILLEYIEQGDVVVDENGLIDMTNPKNSDFMGQAIKRAVENPNRQLITKTQLAKMLDIGMVSIRWHIKHGNIQLTEEKMIDLNDPLNKEFVDNFTKRARKPKRVKEYTKDNYPKLQKILGSRLTIKYCLEKGLLKADENGRIDLTVEPNKTFMEKYNAGEIKESDFFATQEEFAKMLGISTVTITRSVKRGEIYVDASTGKIEVNNPQNVVFAKYVGELKKQATIKGLKKFKISSKSPKLHTYTPRQYSSEHLLSRYALAKKLGVSPWLIKYYVKKGELVLNSDKLIDMTDSKNAEFIEKYKQKSKTKEQKSPNILSRQQLAQELGISTAAINYYISKGEILLDTNRQIDITDSKNANFIEKYKLKSKTSEQEAQNILSRQLLAQKLNITTNTINYYINKGMILLNEDGLIDMTDPKNAEFVEKYKSKIK